MPPLKTRPSLNDIVKILARSRCRPQKPDPTLALLSLSPPTVVIDHVRQEKTPCLDVVIGYPSFSPPCLSLLPFVRSGDFKSGGDVNVAIQSEL